MHRPLPIAEPARRLLAMHRDHPTSGMHPRVVTALAAVGAPHTVGTASGSDMEVGLDLGGRASDVPQRLLHVGVRRLLAVAGAEPADLFAGLDRHDAATAALAADLGVRVPGDPMGGRDLDELLADGAEAVAAAQDVYSHHLGSWQDCRAIAQRVLHRGGAAGAAASRQRIHLAAAHALGAVGDPRSRVLTAGVLAAGATGWMAFLAPFKQAACEVKRMSPGQAGAWIARAEAAARTLSPADARCGAALMDNLRALIMLRHGRPAAAVRMVDRAWHAVTDVRQDDAGEVSPERRDQYCIQIGVNLAVMRMRQHRIEDAGAIIDSLRARATRQPVAAFEAEVELMLARIAWVEERWADVLRHTARVDAIAATATTPDWSGQTHRLALAAAGKLDDWELAGRLVDVA